MNLNGIEVFSTGAMFEPSSEAMENFKTTNDCTSHDNYKFPLGVHRLMFLNPTESSLFFAHAFV